MKISIVPLYPEQFTGHLEAYARTIVGRFLQQPQDALVAIEAFDYTLTRVETDGVSEPITILSGFETRTSYTVSLASAALDAMDKTLGVLPAADYGENIYARFYRVGDEWRFVICAQPILPNTEPLAEINRAGYHWIVVTAIADGSIDQISRTIELEERV